MNDGFGALIYWRFFILIYPLLLIHLIIVFKRGIDNILSSFLKLQFTWMIEKKIMKVVSIDL